MFQRTTRKVSLTAEGLAFLSDAQQIQALTRRPALEVVFSVLDAGG